MTERIVVAMSGGVDSSVAAARLVDQGLEVIGVTLHLWDQPAGAARGRCCAPEDVHDARRVADRLGIAHYTLDRRQTFLRSIVEPFVEDYLQGRTPSPCTRCNQQIKMKVLLRFASLVEAQRVATGHFARVRRDSQGYLRVGRGQDRRKDQSYYLYALDQRALPRLHLVLGDSTKQEVREEAQSRGLAGAGKGESQDLCFVSGNHYREVVERFASDRLKPGNLVDSQGQILGRHGGIHLFTVGQRKGIGLGAGPPRFVVRVDPSTNSVVVGSEEELLTREIWIDRPALGAGVQLPTQAIVQVRYRHEGQPAVLERRGDRLCVLFQEPVRAATTGQAAVAYQDDCVIAGGIITKVIPLGVA